MPVPDTSGIPPFADFDMMRNKVNEIVAKFNNLLVNLDSLNVVKLTASTVVVYDLAGGTGTITLTKDGMTVNNGTFDTFTVDIDGNVTMTSALVRSSAGYPRVELNSATNLIAAFQDANNSIKMIPNQGGVPGLLWTDAGSNGALVSLVAGVGWLLTSFGSRSITLQSGTDINLFPSGNLSINGSNGRNASIQYVKDIIGGLPSYGTMTFTKGLLTNFT